MPRTELPGHGVGSAAPEPPEARREPVGDGRRRDEPGVAVGPLGPHAATSATSSATQAVSRRWRGGGSRGSGRPDRWRGRPSARGSCRFGDRRLDDRLRGDDRRDGRVADLFGVVAGRPVTLGDRPELRLLRRRTARGCRASREASSGCGTGSRTAARPARARRPSARGASCGGAGRDSGSPRGARPCTGGAGRGRAARRRPPRRACRGTSRRPGR